MILQESAAAIIEMIEKGYDFCSITCSASACSTRNSLTVELRGNLVAQPFRNGTEKKSSLRKLLETYHLSLFFYLYFQRSTLLIHTE